MTNTASAQLKILLKRDVEEAQRLLSLMAPSLQASVLRKALTKILDQRTPKKDIVQLLDITQTLLAGNSLFVAEQEALKISEQMIELSVRIRRREEKERSSVVASLLLNRARQEVCRSSDSILKALLRAKKKAASEGQTRILAAMEKRVRALRTFSARTRLKRRFKLPDLNIPAASKNVREDIGGDWYQDPWGWPEVEWLGTERPDIVKERLANASAGWTIPLDIEKRSGGVRPGVIINPLDRLCYQTLVDEVSLEAAGHLPRWVFGWRLSRKSPEKGFYLNNASEWKNFASRVSSLCSSFRFAAHLDIRAFFQTIDLSRLIAQLSRRYRKVEVLDRIETYLEDWNTRQNGQGIPQRALASSVLAHSVLKPLDLYLDRVTQNGLSKSLLASRWMDDIWIHGDNEKELQSVFSEVERLLGELGLGINPEKSRLFHGEEAKTEVQLVDYEEAEEQEPTLPLKGLNKDVPSFRLRLEVGRILRTQNFASLNEIPADGLSDFNEVASSLAKALRVSGTWKRFTEGYINFAQKRFSAEDVSVASWGEMFPNKPERETNKIHEFFSERLMNSSHRLLVPLAAQRISSWSAKYGSDVFSSTMALTLANDSASVFRARGLLFASLVLRTRRSKFVSLTTEASDEATRQFIRDRDMKPPQLSKRFLIQ
jgi:hypothetical protein